jgi:RNA polymerase sigma-70 factor (ECF subfamily)
MATATDNEQFRKLLLVYPAKAIEILYEQFEQSLKKIALKLTQDPLATEDIVQESFMVIWENHKQLSQMHELSIEHYLNKIVRNKSVDFFKERMIDKIFNSIPLNDDHASTGERSIESSIIEQEVSQNLRAVVEHFPRRERECLLMRIDDEMSIRDIANKLNVTTKAIERSLTSARKRLKKHGQ